MVETTTTKKRTKNIHSNYYTLWQWYNLSRNFFRRYRLIFDNSDTYSFAFVKLYSPANGRHERRSLTKLN